MDDYLRHRRIILWMTTVDVEGGRNSWLDLSVTRSVDEEERPHNSWMDPYSESYWSHLKISFSKNVGAKRMKETGAVG